MNLTPREIEALQELVDGVISTLATDGENDPETATYSFWRNILVKLKKC